MTNPPTNHRLAEARRRFQSLYGEGDIRILRAPARINIIGEHVDYVSYLPTASLPFGSREHEMLILFRPTDDRVVQGASRHEIYAPFEFALSDEFAGDDWTSLVFNRPAPEPHWSNYTRGAVFFAQWKHGGKVARGMQFLIDSTIPPGGGSSSSSAIVVLAGAAIREVNRIEYTAQDLAWESSQAEWYLGTRGGALDHTAICLSRQGHAVLMNHHTRTNELIPLPAVSYRWVTFFSHKADKGREVMLEYNERAAVSRLLIPGLLREMPADRPIAERIDRLPESMTLEDFSHRFPAIFQECVASFPALARERLGVPLKIRDRARHHLGEARRVEQAVRLLHRAQANAIDETMRQIGRLLDETHQSMRDLYDLSNAEVDALVEAVSDDPNVYGRRLMGGGFGGNVLALCREDAVQGLIDRVQRGYYDPRGRIASDEGSIMISTPGEGLSHV